MKLLLSWIFDHIDADWQTQDVEEIARRFNQVTAEIDAVEKVSFGIEDLFVGTIVKHADEALVKITELDLQITLPTRPDFLVSTDLSHVYLVKRQENGWVWALHEHFGQDRAALIPVLKVDPQFHAGGWRAHVPNEEIIIDVDNKSLTHRPDMWGHRGFAREIAAFMGLDFIASSNVLADISGVPSSGPLSVDIQTENCKKFVGAYYSSMTHQPSDIFIAFRLLKSGMRVINTLVDITNYLMLDWSQPVHAFDADAITNNKIIVRMARNGEKLMMLGGQELTLCDQDLVIATTDKILGLAGIKGGQDSGVSDRTTRVIFEAATFNATTIRRTAQRYVLRTEAAMRFEKTLSAGQPREAAARFEYLAEHFSLAPKLEQVISVGVGQKQVVITLEHERIYALTGVALTSDQVITYLANLGFDVAYDQGVYTITVPHWRASKDVAIAEDIIEELMRSYGFTNVPLTLPKREQKYYSLRRTSRERAAQDFLAYGAGMLEQRNYSFNDAYFSQQLGHSIQACLKMQNPVSEQMSTLADSLIPGLLKNVRDNVSDYDDLSFFEVGRVWHRLNGEPDEAQKLAGVVFSKRGKKDFYGVKNILTRLLDRLDIPDISFEKASELEMVWLDQYQKAHIVSGGMHLGYLATVNAQTVELIGGLPESVAYVFELDWNLLLEYEEIVIQAEPLAKFQATSFDLSMFTPARITCDELIAALSAVDQRVVKVTLIDLFEKKEWQGKKSLAFRCKIVDDEKTLTKLEIDEILARAQAAVRVLGVELR